MTHSKDNRVTGSGLHNSAAGQAMLIVIAILAILVLLPVVVVTAASQGTSTVASGQDANLYAMQAAEAGVAQFRALLSADPGLVSDYTQGHGANTKGINVTSAITSTTPNLYNYRTGNGPTETPTPKSSSLCSNNFVTMSPDKFSKSGAIRTANWVTVTNTTAPACEHFSIQVVAASTTTSTTNNNCALQNTQTPTVTIVSTGIAGMPYSSKWTEKAVSVTIDNPGYKSTTTPSCAMETNYNLTNAAHSTLNSWLGTAGSIANEAQGLLSAFGISLNSYIPMFGTISSALNSPTERAMLLNMLCDHYAGQKWTLGPINSSMWGNGPPPFCPVDPAGGGWAWTGAFPDPSALLGDLVTGNYSNIGSSVSNVFYSWRTTYNGPVYSNDPLYSCTGPEHGPAYVNFVSAALNIVQGNWGTLIIDAILGVMFTALSDMFTPEQAQFNGPVVAGVSTISGNNFKTYTPPGLGAAENAVQSVLSNYIGSTYAGDLTTVLNYALGQPTCLDATGNGNGSSYGPGQNSNGAQYNSTTNVSPTPIRLPQASSEILTLAVKGQGQAPTNAGGHPTSMYGCLYQGQTVIKFHQNGTMQVWSPDSTTTANDGTSLNTVPDGGSVSDSASSNGCPANGGIAGIPPVIYVENLNTGGTVEPPVNWTDNACDAANNPNNGKCQSEPDGDTDGGRAEPAITWTDGACDAANNPSSYKGSPTGCNKEPDGDEAAEPKTNWNDNTCDAAGNPSGKCQSAPDGDEQQIYVGEPPVNWSDNACDAAGNPGAYPFGTCGLEGAADDTGIGNSDVVDSYTWTDNACDAANNPNNGQCPTEPDGDEHPIYVENTGVNWDDNACDASGNGNWNCGLEGAADKTNTGNSDAHEASTTWDDNACDAANNPNNGQCNTNEGPNSQDGDEHSTYVDELAITWTDGACDVANNPSSYKGSSTGCQSEPDSDNAEPVHQWSDNTCDAAGNPNNGTCKPDPGDGDSVVTPPVNWDDNACDAANNPTSSNGSPTGCNTNEPGSDGVPSSGGSCMPFPNPPFTNLNYGLGTSQNNPIQGQNCANGNAIVQGNLSGKLTIEAQNDVIITNSIYYYGPNCPGQSTAAPSSTCTNFTDLGLVAQGNVDVNHPLNSGVQELNTILSDISTVCSVFGDITGVITDIVNVFGGNGGSNSTLSGLGNLFNLCGSVTNAIQMVVTYEVGMINNDCVGNPSWYSSSGNLINSSAAYNPCSALPAPPYGSTANDSDDTTRPQSQTPFPDPSEPTYIQIDFPDMIRDIGDSVADIVADTASICQGEDCTVSYNWNDGTQPDSGDGDAPGNSDCEATLDSCWGDPAEDGLQIIADAGVDAAGDLLCGDSNPEGSCTQTVPGTDWLSDGGGKNGSLESDNPNCNAGGFSNCLSDGDGDGITLPNPANMQGAFDIFTDWINSNNPVTIAGFTLFTGLDWLMDYLSPDTNFPAFYGMGSHGGQPAVINAAIVAVGPNTGDGSNGTQSIVPMMGPLNCPKWNINCGEFKVNNSSSGYTMGTLHVNGSVTEYYRGKTESYCSSLGNLMSNISSPAPFLNCVMISGYALDLTYAPITSPFLFTTHNYQVTNSFVTQAKTSTPSVNSRVTLPMQIVSPATTTTTHHSPPPTTTHHSPTTTTHHCAIVNGHPICCIGPRCYP